MSRSRFSTKFNMLVMHGLLDFTDCLTNCDRGSIDSDPNYWYEGHCPQSGELLRLPRTRMSEDLGRGLMQYLAADDSYDREGKMYGILLVEMPWGEQRILKAFSGLLNGCSVVDGWVQPIPGRSQVEEAEARTLTELEAMKQELIALKQLPQRQEYEALLREFEWQFQVLSDRHRNCKQQRDEKRQLLCSSLAEQTLLIALEELNQASRLEGIERRQLKRQRDEILQPLKQLIEAADARMRELKQGRKKLSRELQTQMHEAYTLVNFLGKSRSLSSLMPPNSIPTGTGDCCAPKLLHCAAVHNLKPLAMAEFWWGQPSGDKIQGEFYGACGDRCQPLMGFLLSGLAQNQSVSEPKANPDFQSPANIKIRSKVRSNTILNQPFRGGLEAHPTSDENSCGTGILPVTEPFRGGLEAHPTSDENSCGTGILPVAKIHMLEAKDLDLGWLEAHPTRDENSCGTGILPVAKIQRVQAEPLDLGWLEAHPTSDENSCGTGILPVAKIHMLEAKPLDLGGLEAHPTSQKNSCGTGILPVAKIHMLEAEPLDLGGLEAHPTSQENSCGTGILPVTDRSTITDRQQIVILYEDKWLIAVNKPSGLLSVPGRYLENQDSIQSRLRNLLREGLEVRAVHRLDLETSGILLLARDRETYRQLSGQFAKKQVSKVYEAVLSGSMTIDAGTIELPLWGNPENRPFQEVNWECGKPSVTRFEVMAKEGNHTRVEFLPLTGRTHQLRVHAADVRGLGMPILGDRLYGCRAAAHRLHLHARELSFEHLQLGKRLHLQAATPF